MYAAMIYIGRMRVRLNKKKNLARLDNDTVSTAMARHKRSMADYGPTICSTISREHKRKMKHCEAFLRRILKTQESRMPIDLPEQHLQ